MLAIAVALANHFRDSGLTFWHIPLALIGFSVLVAIFARMPQILATVACWILVMLALLFAVGVTGQVLAGNTLPYAKLDCLTGFWKPGACNTSPPDLPDAEAVPVPPGENSAPLAPETLPEADRASAEVYIQFTGFDRDAVKAIAADLVNLGWPVQGADQGGERYEHASGLNEVRFFNPADRERAGVLAQELSNSMGGQPIKVLDVSDSVYAMDKPGHLEIWISD